MQVEEGLPFCKICLEIDTADNLISPCLCTSYVHKECLDTWRLRFGDDHVNRIKCMDCRGEYDYHIDPKVSYYHSFIIYCYTIGVASVIESAACEFTNSLIFEDTENQFCFYLMLPNTVLCLINLCFSIYLKSNDKKFWLLFVCIFNTFFVTLLVFMFGQDAYVVQPIVIFIQSLFAVRNVKAYVLEKKIEGWQLLLEDA